MNALPSLKQIARMDYGDALAQEIREEGEVPVFGSNGITGTHSTANTQAPAIIVGRKGSFGKITWTDVPGFCIDTAYFIDSRHTNCNLRWLYWALQTLGLDLHSEDTGVPGLSREKAYQSKLFLPSNFEQKLVADFLDEQTARIDALIEEKERLKNALLEWQSAELTRHCYGTDAVGVNTGNEWIPSLPPGWSVVRLKHLVFGIEQGWSPECEARNAEEDEWGVLKAGAANGGRYREMEHKALPGHLEPVANLEVKAGDVLITRASGTAEYVGSFAYVYQTRPRLMLSDKNFRLKFTTSPRLLPELLAWMANTNTVRQQVLQFVSGAEGLAKNIGSGNLREIWFPVPPAEEQPEILRRISDSRERVEALSAHLDEHLSKLHEYRASLISSAVTGQLDIQSFRAAA